VEKSQIFHLKILQLLVKSLQTLILLMRILLYLILRIGIQVTILAQLIPNHHLKDIQLSLFTTTLMLHYLDCLTSLEQILTHILQVSKLILATIQISNKSLINQQLRDFPDSTGTKL